MSETAMNSPLVSVVMACYNSERYLEQTIESVLAQTYPHFELIAADDCSTDSTRQLLQAAADKDQRIRVVDREARGGRPAVTKNTALTHVRGKYVCFIDHDDLYLPTKLEKLVSFLETHTDCVAAFHDVMEIGAQGETLHRYLDGFLKDAATYIEPCGDKNYVCSADFYKFQSIHYGALHTLSVAIAVDRIDRKELVFDTQYRVVDDTDLWIRLGLQGCIGYVDEVLACHRQHDSNITRNKLAWLRDANTFFAHNYKRIEGRLSADERLAYRTRIAESLADAAWRMRCAGEHRSAAATYARALTWQARLPFAINVLKAFLPARGV